MSGLPVIRSEASGKTFEPRPFDVFGPKIISNRHRFNDDALETRCLTIETTEKAVRRNVPRQLPQTFNSEAQHLRNKLLRWRFENYHNIKIDESELLSLAARATQTVAPLFNVSQDPEFRKWLVASMTKRGKDEELGRPQAVVVEAIRQLCDGRAGEAPTVLKVSDVAETAQIIAGNWAVTDTWTPKRVGSLVRSLGVEPVRVRTGCQFPVTAAELTELLEKYGPSEQRP